MHAEEKASPERKKRVHKREVPKETEQAAPADDIGLFDDVACEF